jgi:hypothetical protein
MTSVVALEVSPENLLRSMRGTIIDAKEPGAREAIQLRRLRSRVRRRARSFVFGVVGSSD